MSNSIRKLMSGMLAILLVLVCGIPAFASDVTQETEYEVNANGETYGNGLQCADDAKLPDLLLAEGVDGTIGYVRTKDLLGEALSPEDAVEKQALRSAQAVYFIPLYRVDGETVIGQFCVGNADATLESNTRGDYTSSTPWTNQTVGCKGTFISYIKSGLFKVTGKGSVQAHQAMQVGQLGAQVHIYSEDGTLVSSSTMTYSTTATTYYEKEHTYNGDAGTYYYCKAVLAIWNSTESRYWTFSGNKTANVTPSVA